MKKYERKQSYFEIHVQWVGHWAEAIRILVAKSVLMNALGDIPERRMTARWSLLIKASKKRIGNRDVQVPSATDWETFDPLDVEIRVTDEKWPPPELRQSPLTEVAKTAEKKNEQTTLFEPSRVVHYDHPDFHKGDKKRKRKK